MSTGFSYEVTNIWHDLIQARYAYFKFWATPTNFSRCTVCMMIKNLEQTQKPKFAEKQTLVDDKLCWLAFIVFPHIN